MTCERFLGHLSRLVRGLALVACLCVLFRADPAAAGETPKPPRGYSIPLLDLASHAHRQVVVDREAGQYLGHPTTVLLEDGKTMIIVYPKGHGRGAILMKRSIDAGQTWSERLPTPKSWETSLETPTLHRVIDAAGTKRLILFSGLHPIRMAVSEDDGKSWSELKPIGDFGGIVAMASVERLRNGAYLALFHDDGRFLTPRGKKNAPETRFVFSTLSRDGGLTWSKPRQIAHHPVAFLCEPGLLRSPDGKRLAVLLRENSRKFNSFVMFSDDEGETWSTPRELPGALTGDRHVGRYGPDGRLFISFRDTTLESPTRGDWVGWVGTFDDIVHGREGQYRVRLLKNHKGADCAYPGVEVLPDGTFVTTTYGHWAPGQAPYLVSVRFTLGELDSLAKKPRTPVLIAHRGLLRHAPENTLAAYGACFDLRLGIELDVRRTSDGHLVCLHDADVKRTTNGTGPLAAMTLAQARQLDAGGWFAPGFAGQRIPTLEEAFALLRERQVPEVRIAMDLKIDDATVEKDMIRLAEKHGVLEQLVFIGRTITEPAVRAKLRAASARVGIAVLAQEAKDLPAALADPHADWIYVRFVPTAEEAARIRAANRRLFYSGPPVTGNQPDNWRRAGELGGDALLTDFPLECRELWRSSK